MSSLPSDSSVRSLAAASRLRWPEERVEGTIPVRCQPTTPAHRRTTGLVASSATLLTRPTAGHTLLAVQAGRLRCARTPRQCASSAPRTRMRPPPRGAGIRHLRSPVMTVRLPPGRSVQRNERVHDNRERTR
jgi:hypothetical protein